MSTEDLRDENNETLENIENTDNDENTEEENEYEENNNFDKEDKENNENYNKNNDGDNYENEKKFTQEQVNEIITQRLAKEQKKLQERQKKITEQDDPSQVVTKADLLNIFHQVEQEKLLKEASQKLDNWRQEAKERYSDFDEVLKNNHEIVNAFENDNDLANYAARTGQPIEFMYHVAKNYPKEIKKILKISDPVIKYEKMFEIKNKLKSKASVPSKSNAPQAMDDIEGDMDSKDYNDIKYWSERLLKEGF